MADYKDQKIIDKLVTARIALLLKHPFFGNLATRLKLVNADDCVLLLVQMEDIFITTQNS